MMVHCLVCVVFLWMASHVRMVKRVLCINTLNRAQVKLRGTLERFDISEYFLVIMVFS